MSITIMNTGPYFSGVITNTPSGSTYKVQPGQVVSVQSVDVALLETFDFTVAAVANVSTIAVTKGITTVNSVSEIVFIGSVSIAAGADGVVEVTVTGGGGSALTVDDGSTTVADVTTLTFAAGATVADGGSGVAEVTVTGGGGGSLLLATRLITQLELTQLSSVPVVIDDIGLPGAGKMFTIVSTLGQFVPGISTFPADTSIQIVTDGTSLDWTGGDLQMNFTASSGSAKSITQSVFSITGSDDFDNKALTIQTAADLGISGPVTGSSLDNGGADFAPEDTFVIFPPNGVLFGVVDTVDGGGAIVTYHLDLAGSQNHSVATADGIGIIAQTGSGTGASLNVVVAAPETGTATFTIVYYIEDLLV